MYGSAASQTVSEHDVLAILHTGPGYRNVVGLPGGVRSPYYKLLRDANINGMELREGRGNVYEVGASVLQQSPAAPFHHVNCAIDIVSTGPIDS